MLGIISVIILVRIADYIVILVANKNKTDEERFLEDVEQMKALKVKGKKLKKLIKE